MIAKRAFRFIVTRQYFTGYHKIGIGANTIPFMITISKPPVTQYAGKHQFTHSFGQWHNCCNRMRRWPTYKNAHF